MTELQAIEYAGNWVKKHPAIYSATFFGTVAVLVYVGLGNYGII